MAKIKQLGTTMARVQSNVVRNGASKGEPQKNEWVIDVAYRNAQGDICVSDAWYRNRKECPELEEKVLIRMYKNTDYAPNPDRIFVDVVDVEGL